MRSLGLMLACVACSYDPARVGSPSDGNANDDGTMVGDDGRLDGNTQPLGPWGAPMQIPGINSAFNDDDPSMTDDLLELYFGTTRDGFEDIWRATRTNASMPFDPPAPVTELNSGGVETTARVSRDGLSIMFASDRDDPDHDLYLATRAVRGQAFGPPQRVTSLNSTLGDFAGFPTDDRLRVIFSSFRLGDEDLFVATRPNTSASFSQPTRLDISGPTQDCTPTEIDANTIYFATDRDSINTTHIYLATGVNNVFTVAPVDELNSTAEDRDIWVSSDQRTAVFTSKRAGGDDDIFISTR